MQEHLRQVLQFKYYFNNFSWKKIFLNFPKTWSSISKNLINTSMYYPYELKIVTALPYKTKKKKLDYL